MEECRRRCRGCGRKGQAALKELCPLWFFWHFATFNYIIVLHGTDTLVFVLYNTVHLNYNNIIYKDHLKHTTCDSGCSQGNQFKSTVQTGVICQTHHQLQMHEISAILIPAAKASSSKLSLWCWFHMQEPNQFRTLQLTSQGELGQNQFWLNHGQFQNEQKGTKFN